MKVLHVPFTYFPDPVGGTEVFVADLARSLEAWGVESIVAAPAQRGVPARYEHDGVAVHRFPTTPHLRVDEVYRGDDAVALAALRSVLDQVEPDVLHLHAFTSAASAGLMALAKRRGAATVFTYHTPTASCVRGTLMRFGTAVCDGALDAARCAACLLEGRGVPAAAATLVGRLSPRVSATIGRAVPPGRVATALRARELTAARHADFRRLLAEADAVVAVCEWVRALLLRSGARPDRLYLSRQGTTLRPTAGDCRERPRPPVRLAFVGRLAPTKGLHVVIAALARARALPLALDVFGIAQDESDARYRGSLDRLAAGDPRIAFRPALRHDDVAPTLSAYDAVVVPSQWLETGPLAVLEAFAAGVPVIGSELGGIAELVSHGIDGWLVEHGEPRAWLDCLTMLVEAPGLLERLRAGIRPPRTMDDAAADMVALYRTLCPFDRGGAGRLYAAAERP